MQAFLRGGGSARAFPICHMERDGLHTGQVACPLQALTELYMNSSFVKASKCYLLQKWEKAIKQKLSLRSIR